eukprot:TRINITY_DN8764_c1_g7_i1.p2 TRINITY_DN8764_c1_g7~~TRINITY_DN8764_c1_g7_i1.p2  ORF type:complete len:299 (+),score=75.41 TRINITY_DN8764_c1_g7_i1:104-898(+)
MASAIVRGLCTLDQPPPAIILSPRGAEKSAALAKEFESIVTVAASNQEVVDRCDVVFLGVLPKQAEEVARELNFKATQTVVSLVATAPMAMLHECCAPVPLEHVVRVIPLPPVAQHHGATIMTPRHPAVAKLFDALGTCVAVDTEETMKKMIPVTCLMGQFYAQQRAAHQWLLRQGVGTEEAAKWTGAVFHCVSYDTANATSHTFDELVNEQTPGGLNEQVIRELTEAGLWNALQDSMDGCLARIEGRPAPARKTTPYESITEQ